MTVTLVREQDLRGQREFKRTLSEGDTGKRTFYVETNSASHTEADIIVADDGTRSIPAALSLFPGSSTAQLVSFDPYRLDNNPTKWIVVCEYKSLLNQNELERAAHTNPTDRATAISGQSRTIMRPMRRLLRTVPYKLWSEAGPGATWDTLAACNSANDSLDPPIEVAFTEWEIHCEKNVSSFPSWFHTHQNGVNNAAQNVTIMGSTHTFPKGCAKLGNFTFSPKQKENGTEFIRIGWNVTARYPRDLFDTETDVFGAWDEERLDEGLRTYDIGAEKWVNVRDKSGQSVQLPVPFDGAGSPIATSAAIAQSDLWWIAYRPFGARVDYSVIPWS